jgi:peptidoglycan-associated lipoprotein
MQRRTHIQMLLSLSLLLLGLMATACGPTYPKCEKDGHCEDKGEYCLNSKCEECAENSHCASKGPGQQCNAGQCEQIPGYCDASTPCSGREKCRDNRCGPECLDNSECGEGTFCDNGSCNAKPECGDNADVRECPADKECVSGACQIKITKCSSDPVYFDFDQAGIKSRERGKLKEVAQCLKGENVAPLSIEGHCDERGTEEYNMALGERRANSAKKYLSRLGVEDGKVQTTSYGKNRPASDGSNERSWSKNRRTEFVSE